MTWGEGRGIFLQDTVKTKSLRLPLNKLFTPHFRFPRISKILMKRNACVAKSKVNPKDSKLSINNKTRPWSKRSLWSLLRLKQLQYRHTRKEAGWCCDTFKFPACKEFRFLWYHGQWYLPEGCQRCLVCLSASFLIRWGKQLGSFRLITVRGLPRMHFTACLQGSALDSFTLFGYWN